MSRIWLITGASRGFGKEFVRAAAGRGDRVVATARDVAALEGLSESLAQEVSQFGVKVTIVEPGSYETDWAGSSAVHAVPLDAYQPMHDQMAARRGQSQGGDPRAAAQALLRIVDAEQPPLR